MHFYTGHEISAALDYCSLIEALRVAFTGEVKVPQRMHINFASDNPEVDNTLLLMPAIQEGASGGVKIVNVIPENAKRGIESIQGVYFLFDAHTGLPKALFEAKSLTNWRTAATSALASDYLSREDSTCHFMVGTGALAPFVIQAHAAIRPIKKLLIYGRSKQKAEALAELFQENFDAVEVVGSVEEGMKEADIISTATLSQTPLVKGEWLREGQHLDLIGSYKPDMREADDQAMLKSSKFLDTPVALKESGDLAIPLANGVFSVSDILGNLSDLCTQPSAGRSSKEQITLFKSVGYALEDLVAAELVFSSGKG